MNKRIFNILLIAGMLSSFTVLVFGADVETATEPASTDSSKASDQYTVVLGEVVDLSCYIANGDHGEKSRVCALDCLKAGSAPGLVSQDGAVYLLLRDAQNTKAYEQAKKLAAKNVKITGRAVTKDGIKSVVVEKVEAIKIEAVKKEENEKKTIAVEK